MYLAVLANNRTDPTQTSVLRSQFAADMRRRFKAVNSAARTFVLERGTRLGLFFVDEFMPFLEREEEARIYDSVNPGGWIFSYASAGYLAGIRHADRLMYQARSKSTLPVLPEPNPINYRSEIDIIKQQNFTLLRGITSVMNQQIKDLLIQGIYEGLNPRDVADLITGRIRAIGYNRAVTLARSETVRAHAEATLDRFSSFGLGTVAGFSEWASAKDHRVCPACKDEDGKVYTIADARGKIPKHCNCRCCWLPYFG